MGVCSPAFLPVSPAVPEARGAGAPCWRPADPQSEAGRAGGILQTTAFCPQSGGCQLISPVFLCMFSVQGT